MINFSGHKADVISRLSPSGIWFYSFFPDKHSLCFSRVPQPHPPGTQFITIHVMCFASKMLLRSTNTFLFNPFVETKELLVSIVDIRTDLILPWFTFDTMI